MLAEEYRLKPNSIWKTTLKILFEKMSSATLCCHQCKVR